MNNFARQTLGATLLAILCVATAGAQRDTTRARRDTVVADTGRPFVRGGAYDKPFQTRLLGRTAIGGYAEAHVRYQRVDGANEDSGIEAKRFNIFSATRVSDFVRMAAELEFEEGASEIKLEFAAIDVRVHPSFTIRGGMILSPLGKFNLSHDSPLNEFTDRPLVSTEILGVALSEPGVGVLGQFSLGRTGRVTYEAYATNGFHDGLIQDAEDGTRIPLGRGNWEDNNGSPATVARIAWSPTIAHEVGVSVHHGAYNVFVEDGASVDQRRNVTIRVVDGETELLGVQLRGEAAIATVDIPQGLRGIFADRQRGFYTEAVREFGRRWIRTMPESFFALKGRVEAVDFDARRAGSDRAQFSLGLNFRPTRDTAIKFDYVRGRSHDEFNNRSQHAYLLASLATYF
ncbi:MAG TPA: hypothetical protein VJ717_05585 [Gemmatimonadaceae bacterium]|nr:hypothetical protein [Gemmatimonadaceae bacterium]